MTEPTFYVIQADDFLLLMQTLISMPVLAVALFVGVTHWDRWYDQARRHLRRRRLRAIREARTHA